MKRALLVVLILIFAATAWRAYQAVLDNRRFNPETVTGPLDPRGFRFAAVDPETGRPARYNPCEPLHYVVNTTNAPPSALDDVQEAARLTAEVTGIEIVFEGATNEPSSKTRRVYIPELYGERWAPILIGWTGFDPAVFREHDVGIAASDVVENDAGELVYVSGQMILNAGERLSAGFGAGRTWGKVILHEWGHIVGLDHVDDPTQVMHGSLVSSPARWGPGDSEGLRALGRNAGCREQPELP